MDKTEIIAALENEELALQGKIQSLRQTILTLKQSMVLEGSFQPVEPRKHNGNNGHVVNGSNSATSKYEAFFKAKSWREKVTVIFKTENRFLHYREIINIICGLIPGATKESLKNSISPALSFLKSEGVIVKVKYGDSNINSFWGSKNWLNSDGTVKPEYDYDKAQITAGGAGVDYDI